MVTMCTVTVLNVRVLCVVAKILNFSRESVSDRQIYLQIYHITVNSGWRQLK